MSSAEVLRKDGGIVKKNEDTTPSGAGEVYGRRPTSVGLPKPKPSRLRHIILGTTPEILLPPKRLHGRPPPVAPEMADGLVERQGDELGAP